MTNKRLITLLAFIFIAAVVYAQPKANYRLASKYSPKKLDKIVYSLNVDPHWLKNGNRFWYVYETNQGKKWYIVDANKGEKKYLFDNDKMAAEISKIVKDPFDAQNLGLDSIRFIGDETKFQFEVKSTEEIEKKDTTAKDKKDAKPIKEKKVFYFEYDINTGLVTELQGFKKPKRKPFWANMSPDGNTIVFGKHHNLFYMDKANYEKALLNEKDSTIVEHPLTTDGEEYFSYYGGGAYSGNGENNVEKEKNKDDRKPVFIMWSPDSKHFALTKSDARKVKELWVINSAADPRPTIETYKYWMPGEKESPKDYMMVFNMNTKKGKEVKVSNFKDQDLNLYSQPSLQNTRDDMFKPFLWLGTNTQFYFSRTSRDLKKIDQCLYDISADSVKVLIEERMNTSIEIRRPGLVNNGKELIEWSERDGWAHFYLYDENGKLKNQITSGPWHCENIINIDEKKRVLYFTANAKEKNENPYYLHLYKVNFDGTGLKLLNEGDFDHQISLNDNNAFFVNNFSRVNTTPKSVLYNNEGKKVLDLETADLSSLFATGYKFPEPFKVKADDGITDLYGVMYKPFDFDSTKKYPLIEYVYPGPQTEAVNASFSRGMDRVDRLAQLGFIVVTVGNRGGHPSRSKWYHNFGYGNLRDYGLADKKATAEQLADRFSFIDINKVGIHGHSGGGFMSTAAMLVYPDFFKVAVSNAGNHDNSVYNRWWSEKHHGVKEIISAKGDTSFAYSIDKNPDVAKNLKGRLLLIHGEIDNNVHPANTMRVVNALIKANKRFDMLLLPTQRHAFGNMTEYWFWKTADYFTYWLMGDKTDHEVDIEEINREIEKKK
ncbi:MAG TPA: DPP IV N-terminal domain-containing protein [Chitinophagaceae bacterium]|nr:S9 family peptidase [Chitinophagaceae bacterium]MCC6634807.1 DPP IV N-terminal domain-containing protein [Chitinophagaceae bacterium]HMZ46863.1 DPP IV N-terminal domain-containing protein [Chitinophagaceae bacterium]HNF28647.1 DPP IV N-terminal domain-containing protein [Chitinophagaceae bacterium]HNM34324.1 DPP IV N-terminal domain-containing protein [Chitinophagaceae bacterium]